ncbi:MAG: hypothetical protein K2H09_08360 [Treponemataceae bacterium]|nr:hypothetical protein [Treponemataceae bacterium]
MKKAVSLYSTLIVLLCAWGGALLAGCETNDSPFTGPKDKWCEKDFTYENTDFMCYFYYSDTGWKDGTVSNKILKEGIEIGAGLTILIVPHSEGLAGVLTKDQFAIKTFANGDKVEGEGEASSGKSFSVSETSWNLLCAANPSLRSNAESTLPAAIQKNSPYTQIGDYSTFSWKKILAEILVDKLLE